MKPIDGDPARHDHEFDEVRWFTVRDALATMTYPNDIRIMQKAVDVVSGKVRLRSLGQGQSAANDGRPGEGAHG